MPKVPTSLKSESDGGCKLTDSERTAVTKQLCEVRGPAHIPIRGQTPLLDCWISHLELLAKGGEGHDTAFISTTTLLSYQPRCSQGKTVCPNQRAMRANHAAVKDHHVSDSYSRHMEPRTTLCYAAARVSVRSDSCGAHGNLSAIVRVLRDLGLSLLRDLAGLSVHGPHHSALYTPASPRARNRC